MQSTKNDLEKNETINNEQCFVCNRTEADVKEFLIFHLEKATKKYDLEIKNIESELQLLKNKATSNLDNILESTEKQNLDWKISAIREDIDSFKKIIPSVEYLINYNKQDEHFKFKWEECVTLLDVRNEIKKIRDVIDNTKIYETKNYVNEGDYRVDYLQLSVTPFWNSYCNLNESHITELVNTLEELLIKRNLHQSTSEYQKKNIEKTGHKQLTRQIRTEIDYPRYEVTSPSDSSKYLQKKSNIIEIPYSIHVCEICYSLVHHETWADIESKFKENSPPALNKNEKIVGLVKEIGMF